MKWLCISLMFAGCSAEIVEKQSGEEIVGDGKMVQAFVEQIQSADSASRTYLDDKVRMRWTEKDSITVFDMNTYNRTFMFTGKTGANAGGFTQVSIDDKYWFGYDVDYTYAVYPHSTDASLDETDLYITTEMPAVQQYAENTFGLKANTMVAVSNGSQLMFKNVGSYLRVRLYGENTIVSSVTLTTNGSETLSGQAKITPTLSGEPSCEMLGTGNSITLKCAEPVTISYDANAPTDFWLVLPPVTLANGFTVTVQNNMGNTQEFKVDKSFTFARNMYYNLTEEVEIDNDGMIYVAKAGTLPTLISEDEKYEITELTILGDLNGTDINFIREMGGLTVDGSTTEGKLSYLNLSGANFVEGGDTLYFGGSSYGTMENDVLNPAMFGQLQYIHTLILPESLKVMHPLVNLPSLKSITIPGNVIYVAQMFSCHNLEKIEVSPENKVYDSREECNAIIETATNTLVATCKTTMIPSSVTSIGVNAFASRYDLTSITIPEGVTSIGEYAFSGCSNLDSITIPSSVTSIGNDAFYTGRYRGFDIYISDMAAWCNIEFDTQRANPLYFAEHFYLNGEEVKDLVIPNGVAKINDYAFYGCDGLTSVTIPSSVTSIGDLAFYNCDSLSDLYISDMAAWCNIEFDSFRGNPLCYAEHFYLNGVEVKDLVIPNGVTKINDYAFYDCDGLTSVTIPEGVTFIGECAFYRCDGLMSVIIPSSVTSIGDGAFYYCENLDKIYCYAINPPYVKDGGDTFARRKFGERVYVPSGSLSSYEDSEWRHAGLIREMLE